MRWNTSIPQRLAYHWTRSTASTRPVTGTVVSSSHSTGSLNSLGGCSSRIKTAHSWIAARSGLARGGGRVTASKRTLSSAVRAASGNLEGDRARLGPQMHMHPQGLDFPLEATVFLLGAHHDIEPSGAGLQQILEDVRFAIGQGDDAGARTLCGGAADRGERADSFEALFGLDRFVIALGSFAELGRIARPGFDVENAQGQAVRAEGKRTVHD